MATVGIKGLYFLLVFVIADVSAFD